MQPNKIQAEFGVDITSPLYNQRLDELDKMLDTVVGSLNNDNTVKIAKIEEVYFKNIFLPIFLGETIVSHGATLTDWVSYAGGQYLPVDVIDQQGTVIFRVPAIYSRDVVLANIDRSQNIADIMHMAKKHHELSPKSGDAYRVRGLTNVLKNMFSTDNFLANFEDWNSIFKRYGKGFELGVKNNSTAISNDTNQQSNDDDFEYD